MPKKNVSTVNEHRLLEKFWIKVEVRFKDNGYSF